MKKLEDIARLTGYSIGTVSRALNGSRKIAESTRLKIVKLAKESGYLQGTHTVAVYFPNWHFAGYYHRIIEEIGTLLHLSGYQMKLFSQYEIELMENDNPCAVVSLAGSNGLEQLWGQKSDKTLICVNTEPNHLDGVYSVASNDRQGMEIMLNHLFSLGHRRIGFLALNSQLEKTTNINSSKRRIQYFHEFLRSHGLPCDLTAGFQNDRRDFFDAINSLLKKKVTAIITNVEFDSMKTLYYLGQLGIRVPEDISLCGWLDEKEFFCHPSITGVEHDYKLLAQNILVMLNKLIHKEPVNGDILVDYLFHLRHSTSRIKNPSGTQHCHPDVNHSL